jgi:hypothetical protein
MRSSEGKKPLVLSMCHHARVHAQTFRVELWSAGPVSDLLALKRLYQHSNGDLQVAQVWPKLEIVEHKMSSEKNITPALLSLCRYHATIQRLPFSLLPQQNNRLLAAWYAFALYRPDKWNHVVTLQLSKLPLHFPQFFKILEKILQPQGHQELVRLWLQHHVRSFCYFHTFFLISFLEL